MSITGTGTQQDPYMVHTYDELVEVSKTSETYTGTYIKLANDINITDEYPNGDMPTLVINDKIIDGDNKKISNWYILQGTTTGVRYGISLEGQSQIHDCEIANIYSLATSQADFFAFNENMPDYHLVDCKIHGITAFYLWKGTGSYNFLRCSLNIKSTGVSLTDFGNAQIGMMNCNIKYENNKSSGGTVFSVSSGYARNCYIESNVELGNGYSRLDNCACDLHISKSMTYSVNSGSLNIFNSTHAPQLSADGTHWAAVPDDKWLDVDYLSSIGFNAG